MRVERACTKMMSLRLPSHVYAAKLARIGAVER